MGRSGASRDAVHEKTDSQRATLWEVVTRQLMDSSGNYYYDRLLALLVCPAPVAVLLRPHGLMSYRRGIV